MRDTSSTGNKSEAMVLAALVHVGYSTLLPFGGGHPYDIAIDNADTALRVQCKTGRLVKGAVVFPTAIMCRSNQTHGIRWAKDYVIWAMPAGKAGAPTNCGPADGDGDHPADGSGLLRSGSPAG